MSEIPNINQRIKAFASLGTILGEAAGGLLSDDNKFKEQNPELYNSLLEANHHNAWFTLSNIAKALSAWSDLLTLNSLQEWVSAYEGQMQTVEPKNIAVIMAGNIPLVGFHDFLSVLITGHRITAKLSSQDKVLLPVAAEILCSIEPLFKPLIHFTDATLNNFDAVIATGSNNTARYFEYYFSKYPHIIRKSRNGAAVLTGNESEETLRRLGDDICSYFGLGCRNVSKVYIPVGYNPTRVFSAIEPYIPILFNHNKFMNNYNYYRSVYLLNATPHFDNGAFMLTESNQYSSPIPVLNYQFYTDFEILQSQLIRDNEFIQCIVTEAFNADITIPFGQSQMPGLSEYADGINTLEFLCKL